MVILLRVLLHIMLSIFKVNFIFTACNRLRLSTEIEVFLISLLNGTIINAVRPNRTCEIQDGVFKPELPISQF